MPAYVWEALLQRLGTEERKDVRSARRQAGAQAGQEGDWRRVEKGNANPGCRSEIRRLASGDYVGEVHIDKEKSRALDRL